MEEGRAEMSGKEEYPSPEEITVRWRVRLPEKVVLKEKFYITHFYTSKVIWG